MSFVEELLYICWLMSIEHTDIEVCTLLAVVSKGLCFYVQSCPSSKLVDLKGKLFPNRGWRVGSIPTSGQTLVNNCAVMSLTQLCLIEGKAPFG